RQVLLSLGAAGAVLATESGVWRAVGPEVRVRNTVGCGDVLLGGYLQASTRMPPEDALVVAVGAAGIAAGMEGTAEMGRPTLEQMRAGVRRGIGSGLGPEA
ncbi:MAG: PfkB family carbohydrate kinase, partial [Verrucomicrobiota bacterium]|nr:PfkB family carbohydrate kinase [Verrucomicrobiota bacterium]